MKTGSQGTFVISWSQTETDGTRAAPLGMLSAGATWRWTGQPVRVDGPQDMLVLSDALGMEELRRRAARMARRLIGKAFRGSAAEALEPDLPDQCFVVTDGQAQHVITLLRVPGGLLAMMQGALPGCDCDLWVVQVAIALAEAPAERGGVICFTPGTRLATPEGARRIEALQPGDKVLTRDAGPQQIVWRGQRRMTGARLHAMPHLRPIRIRAGAMGDERPDADLLVSPQHRMLVKGPAAMALFNTPEVLVAAEDLLNDRTVTVDYAAREVTYIHILLEQHHVIWANGLETESFHPANASPGSIEPALQAELLRLMPEVANPDLYGSFARRNLSAPEAAILRHEGFAGSR